MLDSSVLVEYFKRTKTDLFDYLVALPSTKICINSTVLSEVTFHWLASTGKKAPRTLQQAHEIGNLLKSSPE